VLAAPDVVILPEPKIFQLPAVGDKAPPEFPVIVSPDPVPDNVTNPLASTVKKVELNEAMPAFVPTDEPAAEAY
jgi:hypothetical protein